MYTKFAQLFTRYMNHMAWVEGKDVDKLDDSTKLYCHQEAAALAALFAQTRYPTQLTVRQAIVAGIL